MTAVDEDRQVIASRYLRKMYSAYDIVKLEEICSVAGELSNLWPDAPAQIAGATIYVGNIFPCMLIGNLVHTSTLLLRRERLRATGLFNTDLRCAGEDYEFHFRTSSQGPVALLDTPSIRYRVGSADQLTQPEFMIHVARNNLTTVLQHLTLVNNQLKLPIRMERVAASYAWVGEAELICGNNGKTLTNFYQSFRYKATFRTTWHIWLSLLPFSFIMAARQLWKSIRSFIVIR
jgi:GT2 family glycosyltransferase